MKLADLPGGILHAQNHPVFGYGAGDGLFEFGLERLGIRVIRLRVRREEVGDDA